jgi:hypothetical protein
MHDARAVGPVQGGRDLDRIPERLIKRQRALGQSIGQGFPFEVLQHQEVGAILMPDIVERANVRVIQCRDRAGFALEALAPIRVAGDVGGEHFNGDRPIEARVVRFVNFTHAAGSEGGEDLVRAKAGAAGEDQRFVVDYTGGAAARTGLLPE